jgi:hypothetical protein
MKPYCLKYVEVDFNKIRLLDWKRKFVVIYIQYLDRKWNYLRMVIRETIANKQTNEDDLPHILCNHPNF